MISLIALRWKIVIWHPPAGEHAISVRVHKFLNYGKYVTVRNIQLFKTSLKSLKNLSFITYSRTMGPKYQLN